MYFQVLLLVVYITTATAIPMKRGSQEQWTNQTEPGRRVVCASVPKDAPDAIFIHADPQPRTAQAPEAEGSPEDESVDVPANVIGSY